MKVNTISIEGKVTQFELSEKIFSAKVNKKLIAHVLYSEIANSKPRVAKTKQRNQISGSTAKIYAQKGTGNARHSSRKAPIFVGGGVAHGPKGNVHKHRKVNKKEKRTSLISAITQKTNDKRLIIVEDFRNKINRTREFNDFLKKNKLENVLFITDNVSKKNIELSARNIPNVKLVHPLYLNTYDVLKYNKIIFTKSSIKELEKRLINNE